MVANRSTELVTSALAGLWRDLRGLGGNERIAVIGAAVMVGSLLLPFGETFLGIPGLVFTGYNQRIHIDNVDAVKLFNRFLDFKFVGSAVNNKSITVRLFSLLIYLLR